MLMMATGPKPMSLKTNDTPIWMRFNSTNPPNPYCSDDLQTGVLIRNRTLALRYKHIQLNTPMMTAWLPFDVDHEDAFEAWEVGNLPAPNIVAVNLENGHAHLSWHLKHPVPLTPAARNKPIQFAQAVERGMRLRMNADPSYGGLLTKNPWNNSWRTQWLVPNSYLLDELAGWLTPAEMRYRPKTAEQFGWLGRNSAIFEIVRHIAYKKVLEFK